MGRVKALRFESSIFRIIMKNVKADNGAEVRILSFSDIQNVIVEQFGLAFQSGNLLWDRIAIKDSQYVMFSERYMNGDFSRDIAKVLNRFKTATWSNYVDNSFGKEVVEESGTEYVENAFDCDKYGIFTKILGDLAVVQHYPELESASAIGTMSYVPERSDVEEYGVAHEINFYMTWNDWRNAADVKFFEPQPIFKKGGFTVNLTVSELVSTYNIRL